MKLVKPVKLVPDFFEEVETTCVEDVHRDLEKEEKIHDFLQRETLSPPSYRQRYGLLHSQCLECIW